MTTRRLRVLILATAVGALGSAAAFPFSAARAASLQAATYAPSETGLVPPAAAVHPSSNSAAALPAQRSPRVLPGRSGASRTAPARPAVTSPTSRTSPSILSNFNGTSSKDSGLANFNQEFEPPDQGLCVGNGYVLEPVNSAYRIFNSSGATLDGPFNVNDLFNEGALQFTSDPRCYYDPTTNTWFATILFLSGGGAGPTSHLDIAVNPTGNPLNVWTEYQIDTTDSHNKGCGKKEGGCFGDQPRLGIDQNNLYVTADEFGIPATSTTFNGAQIFAFAKSDLIAGKPVHYALFKNLKNADGSQTLSVQPAISTGTPSAEYFMDSLDPTGAGDNRIGVWALTNGAAVASGGKPTLSTIIINSEAYAVPPGAIQKGATSLLDAGDDRMQQTQSINGTVWGELDTAVNIAGDTATRAAGAWFAVNPSLSGGHIVGATIARQGYVAKTGQYVLYPAVQANASGDAAMVFTVSGSALYASAAYASLDAAGSSFGAIHIAANGSGPYDPAATRWGDYSWAVIDPTADAFWLATEYMPPLSSQTPDGLRNWGTRVFEVSAG